MAIAEKLDNARQSQQLPQRSLWREAQAAIRVRDEKPFEFTPLDIAGESLSDTIIRERRGEL